MVDAGVEVVEEKQQPPLGSLGILQTTDEENRVLNIEKLLAEWPVRYESLMGEIHYALSYPSENCIKLLLRLSQGALHYDNLLAMAIADKAWKVLCQKYFSPVKDPGYGDTQERMIWTLARPELLSHLVSFFSNEANSLHPSRMPREFEIVKGFLTRLSRNGWDLSFSFDDEKTEESLRQLRPHFIKILCRINATHILLESGIWQKVTDDDMKCLAQTFIREPDIVDVEDNLYLGKDEELSLCHALVNGEKAARVYVVLRECQRARKVIKSHEAREKRLARAEETIRRLKKD